MRYQIEIDAPLLIGAEAENPDAAEKAGDAIYALFWDAMSEAVKALAAEMNADVLLGARYDNTDVVRFEESIADAVEAIAKDIDETAHPDSEWARERREGLR